MYILHRLGDKVMDSPPIPRTGIPILAPFVLAHFRVKWD